MLLRIVRILGLTKSLVWERRCKSLLLDLGITNRDWLREVRKEAQLTPPFNIT